MKTQYNIKWGSAILIVLLAALATGYGQSPRNSTHGDHLQTVKWIALANGEPRVIVAGVGGVLMYSDDLGITWQRPAITTVSGLTPSNKDITCMDFNIYTGEGVAVGRSSEYPRISSGHPRPIILRTTDYGTTWQPISAPVTYTSLNSVAWVTGIGSRNFVAVGEGSAKKNILRTSDGGQTWTAIDEERRLTSVTFNRGDRGIAVGPDDGLILLSSDEGETWYHRQNSWRKYWKVAALDGTTGIFVGNMHRVITYEWLTPPGQYVVGVSGGPLTFAEETTYFGITFSSTAEVVVGELGRIYYRQLGTQDFSQRSSQTLENLLDVDALDNHVMAVGYSGTILYSSDGGATWVMRSQQIKHYLNNVYFTNTSTGIAIGDRGTIVRTTNAGDQWNTVASPSAQGLYGIDFYDANDGYLVGDKGVILRTFDGGAGWQSVYSGTKKDLKSIAAVPLSNNQTAVAVGIQGTILRTTNGGTTWQKLASGVGQAINISASQLAQFRKTTLYDIRFLDDGLTGYAVGAFGTILKTTNGGMNWGVDATWSPGTSTVKDKSTYYRCIGFEGVTDVPFLMGYQYRRPDHQCPSLDPDMFDNNRLKVHPHTGTTIGIYRTNNGMSWTAEECGSMGWFYDVDFPTDSKGYAASFEGTLYRIERAGAGYDLTPLRTHTRWPLRGVFFVDGSTGYAVGARGTIVKTTDGGDIWHKQYGAAEPEEIVVTSDSDQRLQVQPNPFQSQTTIAYTLPDQESVTLQVQDLYGRVVATLIDNRLQGPGHHSIDFDGADLAAGTYFCTLRTAGFSVTRQMVLVK